MLTVEWDQLVEERTLNPALYFIPSSEAYGLCHLPEELPMACLWARGHVRHFMYQDHHQTVSRQTAMEGDLMDARGGEESPSGHPSHRTIPDGRQGCLD